MNTRYLPASLIPVLGCFFSPSALAQEIGAPFQPSREVIGEGIALYDEDRYKEAIMKFASINRGDSLYPLAQYELALSLIADKQYDKAIAVSRGGTALSSELISDFYLQIGAAYDDKKQYDSALAIYDRAIQLFPYNHRFQYLKAVTFIHQKKYTEALASLEECLKMNPFYAPAHKSIGALAADANQPAIALMALQTYVLTEDNHDNVMAVIDFMEKLAKNEFKPDTALPENVFSFAAELNEVNDVINSKAALSDRYKAKVNLNFYLLKQLQVMCEKLPGAIKENNWTLSFYYNFYKGLWDAGHFEGMALLGLQNIDNPQIKKEVARNKKKLEAFGGWAHGTLDAYRNEKTIVRNGKNVKLRFHYDNNGYLEATGNYDAAGKADGYWEYFYRTGQKQATGNFKNGEKDGDWTYYHVNGAIKSVEPMKNGVIQGTVLNYYDNGAPEEKITYKSGKLDGKATLYYPSGAPKVDMVFVNEKRNGPRTEYSKWGVKETEYSEADGVTEGPYNTYYYNGSPDVEGQFQKDKPTGKFTYHYTNGKVRSAGDFQSGERNGEWLWYHANGKVQKSGAYKAGKENGTWKYYDENGKLTAEENYESGLLKGITRNYYSDGKVFSEFNYKSGKLDSYKFQSPTGSVYGEGKASGSKLAYQRYNELGIVVAEGQRLNGEENGPWKYYYNNGALEWEVEFVNGQKTGIQKSYFKNGKLEAEGMYEGGELSGFYRSYYSNGQTETEGYYVDGKRMGEWLFYNTNGSLESREYYYEGTRTGYDEEFYADGVKEGESDLTHGFFSNFIDYDSAGNPIASGGLKLGTGLYAHRTTDGKPVYEANYLYGYKHGQVRSLFRNGKTQWEQPYIYGNKHGYYKAYNRAGKLLMMGRYTDGGQDSIWSYFTDEGKLYKTASYKEGDLHGVYKTFYEDGKVEFERMYKDGTREGESNLYGPDGSLILKVYYTEGVMTGYTYPGKDGQLKPVTPLQGESGVIKTFYPNGTTAVEYTLKNGWIEGRYLVYYPDGKLYSETEFRDNDYHGINKEYYPGGTLRLEENYADDKRNGVCKTYYDNGKLQREANYLDDALHGTEQWFDKTGKLTQTNRYQYGYDK